MWPVRDYSHIAIFGLGQVPGKSPMVHTFVRRRPWCGDTCSVLQKHFGAILCISGPSNEVLDKVSQMFVIFYLLLGGMVSRFTAHGDNQESFVNVKS